MRIKGFTYEVNKHLESCTLNNTTVIVDGHNIFYSMYRTSGLPYALGPESDRFAAYIKKYFEIFKKANVNCLVVFKGGHENEDALDIHREMRQLVRGKDFKLGHFNNKINPLFAKDIFLQTLKEMGFKCIVCCRNDIVQECVALARHLSCPIISFNIQYCFHSISYIPLEPGKTFILDENNNLKCQKFTREKFLKDYKITVEKMILFILLLDTHIFEENTYNNFLLAIRAKTFQIKYGFVLKWLHSNNENQALRTIFEQISDTDRSKFLKEREILRMKLLGKTEPKSNSVVNFINENEFQIEDKDALWFEKGVYLHHISIDYVDLYLYKIVKGSHLIEDFNADVSCNICVDVIKYAYDLLTNFKGDNLTLWGDNSTQTQNVDKLSIAKPEYKADCCVFERGWDNVKDLFLFEHFLIETFQTFNFDALETAPADSRMLLIALVFFTRKKVEDVVPEIYSVILSYVMLNVVAEKVNIRVIGKAPKIVEQPSLDPITDKDSVLTEDCEIAAAVMRKYFEVSDDELHLIFDLKTVHPLVEFQRCLKELNNLNTLCGASYDATVYSRTYNGTFVYKILCDIKESDNAERFITNMLNPAATVLAFVEGMMRVYNRILYEF
ncbi:unnamed protein product [Euphydryas editha]|uniref:Protein asteroid n=1 Tax=Euphydryas editha TaxID=104508 RepID=A0AAU9U7I3_EUPED|nr:unnamed protein product [Euphydryas editha]